MKRSNEIIGAPVISIAAGMQVGTIKGLVVNPGQKTVEFLLLNEPGGSEPVKGIPFRYAEGVGEYAITVENESMLMDISRIGILQELLEKNISIIGTKVITRKGKYLGDAGEFSVDTDNGTLKEIHYQADNESESSIPIQQVITLGKEVLVVEDAAGEGSIPPEGSQVNFKGGDEKSTGSTAIEQPAKELPQTSQPVTEEPAMVQPVVEQPPVVQPVTEEPVVEPPALEQPETEQPVAEQAPEEPVSEEPAVEQGDVSGFAAAERDMLTSKTSGDLDPADAFIQKQKQFLIGKTLLKDVQSREGEVIAWENEVVTEELFEKVYKMGPQKVMELAVSVRD